MTAKTKKKLLNIIPYVAIGLFSTNIGEAIRLSTGKNASEKMLSFLTEGLGVAFENVMPSLVPFDLLIGALIGGAFRLIMYIRAKNAKKFRHGREYGSARWGTPADIEPFKDPTFKNNVILTATESLTMESRPKAPKYARNKNVLCVGGSGSGKTRFFIKPNLLQMHSSYVVTDPKGQLIGETGRALYKNGYDIKVFNTINFKKSMHYNPFMYIHSEKDILKLVTALISNTKGEGNGNDPFWEKAETLFYTALIGYIYYEAPTEEKNFATMIEFINAFEVREDDEDFKNAVDRMFDRLKKKDPNHFAVRQYAKFKLAAGVINYKRFLIQSYEQQPMAA